MFNFDANIACAARTGRIALCGFFMVASLYSSAGRAELLADNILFQVEKAAQQQLSKQAALTKLAQPLFEVTIVKTTRALEACRQTITVEPIDTRLPNRMRFVAVCAGSDGWRYEFVVHATVSAMVVVAKVPLTMGQALTLDELILERRDVSAIADSMADVQAVVGLSSRRTLRTGELLRQSQLVAPTLIKRGEIVRIVARRAQIEVSVTGEAMDAGAQDAIVRVRNAASRNVIRARVVKAGTVEPVAVGTQSPD